jgi:ATP-binding cassette subfamily F protein 3
MGLVGVNGSGKSTLLKLIEGALRPTEGSVSIARGASSGLLTQQADIRSDLSVADELARVFDPVRAMESRLRELERDMAGAHGDEASFARLSAEYARLTDRFEEAGGYEWPSRVQGVLAGLGFSNQRQAQPAHKLSGGEKTRLCLARLLLVRPDLLMLDEPTNHLDLNAIQWLEETLKKYTGTIIIVSHDRYFLNAVCDCMAEISMTRLTQYDGNYDAFTAKREAVLERQLKEYKMQRAEITRQQAIIARYRMYNREKSIRAAESREKRLSKMELVEAPVEEHKIRFSFEARRRMGDEALAAEDISKRFDGRLIFERFNLRLRSGDRVALIGPNGIGKTTLLKIIIGRLAPDSGYTRLGANVDIGYYDQHQDGLCPEKTAFDDVWDDFPKLEPGEVRSRLALFLLTGDEVFKPISALSGGERGRVALCKLMLRGDNLLLLDEPTNHLDMDSREVLEAALEDYAGTMLFVSHDRYFINRIADRVIEMDRGGVREYLGNYDDYIEKKRRGEAADDEDLIPAKTRTEMSKEKRRLRAERESKEALALKVKELEGSIHIREANLKKIEAELADPMTYRDIARAQELAREHSEIQEALGRLYDEWAEAMET